MSNSTPNNESDKNSASLNNSFQGFHTQSWSESIVQLEQSGTHYVIATVLGTSGSTPRASGTKMVISGDHIYDTLGGGHLEFKVIEKARTLIAIGKSAQVIEQFHLAANLGQCCGGGAVILFEVMVSQHMKLDVYGAGHVAQALIPILAQLPIRIRWIDNREHVFPQHIPDNVIKVIDESPVEQAKLASSNSAFLILTHNHQLDFELTEAILKRNDALWLGVIGSDTKAKRFKYRLTHKEFSDTQIEKMVCPVGLSNITGKLPMEVAVSISGQLIDLYQHQLKKNNSVDSDLSNVKKPSTRKGLEWKALKNVLISDAPLSTTVSDKNLMSTSKVIVE